MTDRTRPPMRPPTPPGHPARRRTVWAAAALAAAATLTTATLLRAEADPSDTGSSATPDAAELRRAYAQPAAEWPPVVVDPGVEPVELGLLPEVTHPDDNPHREAKADFGRQLFFDPRLSVSDQRACASCHDPDLGWADGRTVSFGRNRLELPRNSPTIMNAGHQERLFWDARASSLEDLVLKVVENRDEMHGVAEEVAKKIDAVPEYRAQARAVFGVEHVGVDEVTGAIACFVRTVNGGRSAFDRFLRGREHALSDAAVRGLHLFRTAAKCMNCHHGPTLSDGKLHATGLSLYGTANQDLGAYAATGDPADSGKFRTPPLRHISRTAPYMHHGLFAGLDNVVMAYNGGMPTPRAKKGRPDDPPFPEKSPLVHPLDLSDEQLDDLVAFLESLEEPHRRIEPPALPAFMDPSD